MEPFGPTKSKQHVKEAVQKSHEHSFQDPRQAKASESEVSFTSAINPKLPATKRSDKRLNQHQQAD